MAVAGINPTYNAAFDDQQVESGGINDVNIDDFLKIMITELQNQDPLNPLENDELIAQIGQIRSVGATEKLTETLDSVLLGQNIASATNLIGAEIDAISDDNQKVTGVVDKISVAGGKPKLHLDLNPRATISNETGEMDEGQYEYLVVWTQKGVLQGVDPLANATGKKIRVEADGGAVQLSNLPETSVAKHVYRREVGSEDYHLVGSIADGKKATFLDTVSNDDLSPLVLGETPTMVTPNRKFTVSLNNVGEIRPPAKLAATAPTTPTTPTDDDDDDPARTTYRPPVRPDDALRSTYRPPARGETQGV
jgi:flagellar basal-body rod modification protein FlgD